MKSLALGVLLGVFGPLLAQRCKQIGEVARARRVRLEPPAGVSAPGGDVDAPGDDDHADELEQLTRPELYRRAQAAGIGGRSEMTKAQLVAALRASSQRARKT